MFCHEVFYFVIKILLYGYLVFENTTGIKYFCLFYCCHTVLTTVWLSSGSKLTSADPCFNMAWIVQCVCRSSL